MIAILCFLAGLISVPVGIHYGVDRYAVVAVFLAWMAATVAAILWIARRVG